MHINSVDNVNFKALHIAPTKANKIVLEKFLKTSPEILNQALLNLDRASGDEDIFLKAGLGNGSPDIPIAILSKGDNILTMKRINSTKADEMKGGFKNLLDSYVRTIGKTRPSRKSQQNETVENILNKYV